LALASACPWPEAEGKARAEAKAGRQDTKYKQVLITNNQKKQKAFFCLVFEFW